MMQSIPFQKKTCLRNTPKDAKKLLNFLSFPDFCAFCVFRRSNSLFLENYIIRAVLVGFLAAAVSGQKPDTATLNGRVTLDGAPAAQVQVTLFADDDFVQTKPLASTFTDREGVYTFANLTPGRYDIVPRAPAAILANYAPETAGSLQARRVTLKAGEVRAGVDLELTAGGVITGRATSASNRAVAGADIDLFRLDEKGQRQGVSVRQKTDDRGVYRLFGLPAGRYVVCLVARENGAGRLQATCAPNVGERDEATVYEVKPGQEIANADIRALPRQKTYTARGRIFNAETGQPANVHLQTDRGSLVTVKNGGFVATGLLPGRHQIVIFDTTPNRELTGDPVAFEITDQDVDNLEMPLRPGLTLQGTVIVENTSRVPSPPLSLFSIGALMMQPEGGSVGYAVNATIDEKGNFRVSGLQARVTELRAYLQNSQSYPGLYFLRLERNGVPVGDGKINLTDGKSVTGLRLVYGLGTGIVRGKITVVNGELPENARFNLIWEPVTNRNASPSWTHPNINLEFEAKNLFPGEYQVWLEVGSASPIKGKRGYWAKELHVTVVNDTIVELPVTLDLTKDYVERPY